MPIYLHTGKSSVLVMVSQRKNAGCDLEQILSIRKEKNALRTLTKYLLFFLWKTLGSKYTLLSLERKDRIKKAKKNHQLRIISRKECCS